MERNHSLHGIPSEDDVPTANQPRYNSTTTPHILQNFHAHGSWQIEDSGEECPKPASIYSDKGTALQAPVASKNGSTHRALPIVKRLLQSPWAKKSLHADLEDGYFPRTEHSWENLGVRGSIPWIWASLYRRSEAPSIDELARRVEYFFPPRAHLLVQIYDFGDGQAARNFVNMGNMEREMFRKPDWAVIRWIHAPLGIGLYHSSFEDIFLNGLGQEPEKSPRQRTDLPRGKPFRRAGRTGWPYLATEIVNIRSFKEMSQMRSASSILKENSAVKHKLNQRVFEDDQNEYLISDILRRADHLGLKPSFWETAKSDMPWLLSDGALGMKSPAAVSRETSPSLKRQTLQDHSHYREAYIARDSFRCFHRADGYVLSLSPANGIDYLDKSLRNITKNRLKYQYRKTSEDKKPSWPSQRTSAITRTYKEFALDGVKRWSQRTSEWLMVFLLTEVTITPHSQRSGYGAPSILDAYDAIIHKLIQRKFEPWARDQTVSLVQSYLASMDELAALARIYRTKLDFLRRLMEDCKEMESDYQPSEAYQSLQDDPAYHMTMVGRVDFAIAAIRDDYAQCDQLYTDLKASLNALFQLRSIEQNDRAIHADSQSKAVFVFTALTTIFLPLMFMTSYFGMNVKEIAGNDSEKSQAEFWAICAPLTLGIISLVTLYIWLNKVRAIRKVPDLMAGI